MKQRTGTARSSASEGYMMEKYTDLWHHIQRYKVDSFDEGLEYLRWVGQREREGGAEEKHTSDNFTVSWVCVCVYLSFVSNDRKVYYF